MMLLTMPGVVSTTSTVATEAKLNTLVEAVVKAGLVEVVDTTPGITIFAPTDDAFDNAKIDPSIVPADTLKAVLANHVVPAVDFSTDLKDGQKLKTLGGATLTVHIEGNVVRIDNARVQFPNNP